MELQTESKTDKSVESICVYSEIQETEAEFIKLKASYTFHVDFESPVFADLSISCNNPGENFSSHILNEMIRSKSKCSWLNFKQFTIKMLKGRKTKK